jgi:hypothetical protein
MPLRTNFSFHPHLQKAGALHKLSLAVLNLGAPNTAECRTGKEGLLEDAKKRRVWRRMGSLQFRFKKGIMHPFHGK